MLLSKSRFPLLMYVHTISPIILTSLAKTPGTPGVTVEDLGSRFDCVLEITLNFSDKKSLTSLRKTSLKVECKPELELYLSSDLTKFLQGDNDNVSLHFVLRACISMSFSYLVIFNNYDL